MAKKIKVGINGFGRIGRAAFKVILDSKKYEVVAINDLGSCENLAQLLRYDTVYGKYDKKVTAKAHALVINGKSFPVTQVPEPKKIPWKKYGVEVVLECTGRFVKDGAAKDHLKGGAKKVIISAPAKGGGNVETFVMGVNNKELKGQSVISNASCTTNCIAPVAAVLHSKFGVEKAIMTTIHAYTSTQNIVDGPHKDPRRGRAAAQNIVPTTTGAAIATTETIPELKGLFDGMAVRVPVINGSLADFTFLLKKDVTVDQVNNALKRASKTPLFKNVLTCTDEPVVSSDIIGNTYSAIVDLGFTKVVGGNLVKVVAWYDNEAGYANRLVDMVGEVL